MPCTNAPFLQPMAWYVSPKCCCMHLVALDRNLYPLPTSTQQELIISPEEDPVNAGNFYGQFLHLN